MRSSSPAHGGTAAYQSHHSTECHVQSCFKRFQERGLLHHPGQLISISSRAFCQTSPCPMADCFRNEIDSRLATLLSVDVERMRSCLSLLFPGLNPPSPRCCSRQTWAPDPSWPFCGAAPAGPVSFLHGVSQNWTLGCFEASGVTGPA